MQNPPPTPLPRPHLGDVFNLAGAGGGISFLIVNRIFKGLRPLDPSGRKPLVRQKGINVGGVKGGRGGCRLRTQCGNRERLFPKRCQLTFPPKML